MSTDIICRMTYIVGFRTVRIRGSEVDIQKALDVAAVLKSRASALASCVVGR